MKQFHRWIQILGITLILASLGLAAASRLYAHKTQAESAAVAKRMEQILTVRTTGVSVGSGPMPVMELSGRDYACLLEVPELGVSLPVCNDWQERSTAGNPCRYWGSAYDGSLIIGGGEMAQLDFCGLLDLGDRIVITDMRGQEYVYFVTSILRADSLTFQRLREGEEPLTIFTRDGLSNRKIVVRCSNTS